MKLTAREDIDAPLDVTFEMLCDFEGYERQALRRGAEVARSDTLTEPGVGMCWNAAFDMRGKRRTLTLDMTEFDRPDRMVFAFASGGLEGVFNVDCVALSKTRTRVQLVLDMKPTTLSARLLIQSLKLARTTILKRFRLRTAEYAKALEDRYRRRA